MKTVSQPTKAVTRKVAFATAGAMVGSVIGGYLGQFFGAPFTDPMLMGGWPVLGTFLAGYLAKEWDKS